MFLDVVNCPAVSLPSTSLSLSLSFLFVCSFFFSFLFFAFFFTRCDLFPMFSHTDSKNPREQPRNGRPRINQRGDNNSHFDLPFTSDWFRHFLWPPRCQSAAFPLVQVAHYFPIYYFSPQLKKKSFVLIISLIRLLRFERRFTSLELDGGARVSPLPPFKAADKFPIYHFFLKLRKELCYAHC